MSDNASQLAVSCSNSTDGSAEKAIYGVNCYNGKLSAPKELTSSTVILTKFDYKWKVSCVRNEENEAEKARFLISTELISRYTFDDQQSLLVYLKHEKKNLLTKELVLDKSQAKEDFEIPYIEDWSVPFDKIEISVVLWVKKVQYYRSNWATEYCFTNKFRPHDVVLVVGELRYYVFRNYLATWSPYFDRLFYGDFKEKNQQVIVIEDVISEDFDIILHYIHPQLSRVLGESDVIKVLKLADRFEIPNLMARCGEVLCNFHKCRKLELMDRLELADKHYLVSLQIACFERIHMKLEKSRADFFEKNRRRIQNLSYNPIKNLI